VKLNALDNTVIYCAACGDGISILIHSKPSNVVAVTLSSRPSHRPWQPLVDTLCSIVSALYKSESISDHDSCTDRSDWTSLLLELACMIPVSENLITCTVLPCIVAVVQISFLVLVDLHTGAPSMHGRLPKRTHAIHHILHRHHGYPLRRNAKDGVKWLDRCCFSIIRLSNKLSSLPTFTVRCPLHGPYWPCYPVLTSEWRPLQYAVSARVWYASHDGRSERTEHGPFVFYNGTRSATVRSWIEACTPLSGMTGQTTGRRTAASVCTVLVERDDVVLRPRHGATRMDSVTSETQGRFSTAHTVWSAVPSIERIDSDGARRITTRLLASYWFKRRAAAAATTASTSAAARCTVYVTAK